ncbi:MAG: choline ABC transporter ATP-binding protein [Gammaproteobacteria bacterium]
MNVVEFDHVDIVFGPKPERALKMLDEGADRQTILEKTGNVLGVADCSLNVSAGEICVLMGLSGSGKSTLLRGVNGLNKINRGQIRVRDGEKMVDVAHCDAETLRHIRSERVAMVFQQFALLPWRTVRENVGLGLELRGMDKAERDRVVEQKLELVGLSKWANKYANELSGGMQQRVGLARAFATDADILLMDEPFSALDPLIRTHLQDELLELQQRLNKTIIFVSHDLDEALKLGTHIVIMENGRIVQFGRPEEIVLKPANAYVAQFVAHMNPLNVLRGTSLMTPIDALKRLGDRLQLDWTGHHVLELDNSGAPAGAMIEGKPARLLPYANGMNLEAACQECLTMVTAPPDILMKTAVEIRHATGRPVPLVEEGRMVGVIGDTEVYRGMLRQTALANKDHDKQ